MGGTQAGQAATDDYYIVFIYHRYFSPVDIKAARTLGAIGLVARKPAARDAIKNNRFKQLWPCEHNHISIL